MLLAQLEKLGHAVQAVPSGEAALQLVEEETFDLVFMDCQMPGLDGYTTTRALRERGFGKPVVALTAHAMAGEKERCLQAGMDDFLTKPASLDAIGATVTRWVSQATVG